MEALVKKINEYVTEYGSFSPCELETPYVIKFRCGYVQSIDIDAVMVNYDGRPRLIHTAELSLDTMLEVLYACMLRAKEIEELISYFESKFTEQDFQFLRA